MGANISRGREIGRRKTEIVRLLASTTNKAAPEWLTLIRLIEEVRGLDYGRWP